MALIIGSTAMARLIPNSRLPKDLDVFARPNDPMLEWNNVADRFWHDKFSNTQLDVGGYADLNQLYTIKVSHAYWELRNGSWDKHMFDILTLQNAGAKLIPDLHKLLYSVWVETHGSKKMNLAQSAGMFFKDAVVRIYDHDSIHASVTRYKRPIYEDYLLPGEEVNMDMTKVWASDHSRIVELFREEVAATALERWLIPLNYKFSPGLAWKLALKKTITSLTRGKSAQFMVENFREFMKPMDTIDNESYLARHLRQKDRLIKL